MKVQDLLTMPKFRLELRVPGPATALHRTFSWSIPMESLDPRPFLAPNTLILTSGISMNVTDTRVWDAYVERLSFVQVTALVFALGPAHKEIPEGLVAACEHHEVPLLVIPSDIPFPLVQREIQNQITTERYEMVRQGSELAQECTELVARGGTLQDLLQLISAVTERRVAIEDRTGMELLRAGGFGEISGRAEFTLPGLSEGPFRLVFDSTTETPLNAALVRPSTAVVALQLNATLGSTATTFSRHTGRLLDAIFSRDSIPTEELLTLTSEAELDAFRPIGLVMLEVHNHLSTTYLRTVSWRMRARLATEYPSLRFVEDPALATLLVQGEAIEVSELLLSVQQAVESFEFVSCLIEVVENAAELGLAIRHLRRSLGKTGVQIAPPMNFDAVVDTLRHPGTESMSRRLLAPIQGPKQRALRETLEAYIRHSGTKAAICEELYIHRNTLTNRLVELERLLGVHLDDGQTRATLLLALRLLHGGTVRNASAGRLQETF